MGGKTGKMDAVRNKAIPAAKNIAAFFLVMTGLELVVLPLLCYEFAFRKLVLEGQLENFRGDPQPGPLAAGLPSRIRHMHERMLSCFLYTGVTIVKQIFNIVLLVGYRKNDLRLVLAWLWGFSTTHAAATAVALWYGVLTYFDTDIVSGLVMLYVFVLSGVVLVRSAVVLGRAVRQQRKAAVAADSPAC